MQTYTNEFSFILKVSEIAGAGIGVYALHDIASGVWLEVIPRGYQWRKFKEHEIPKELLGYCIAKGNNIYTCPHQFNCMYIGYYMNHSPTPNTDWDDDLDGYVSIKPIRAGEEILIDYNLYEEPQEKTDAYYHK